MKFTQVPSQHSNQIQEVQARNEVWVHAKAPSHCLSCKSSAALQLFKQLTVRTLADYQLQKSMGQTSNRNRPRLPSLFGMRFTHVPSQYSNQIQEVQARNEVWVHAKVPSCRLSCKSSAALQLFKQLTALLQTIKCRNVWGKQPTGTDQGSPHCLV
jgi:hypothetical protein